MKPRGPLMIEHRLIEKVLSVAGRELEAIGSGKNVDPLFIDTIVDFIRMYADRTHHGKEEDILFKALEGKKLDRKDDEMMRDLIGEHVSSRRVVGELVAANAALRGGDSAGRVIIAEKLSYLVNFYPVHIEKEDKFFFPDTERYFSDEELDSMLRDFWEFDKKMIHEKYQAVYESLKK